MLERTALTRARETALGRLRDGYVRGELGTGTFEGRVETVLAADSRFDLEVALWDLAGGNPYRRLLERLGLDAEVGAIRVGAVVLSSDRPRAAWTIGRSRSCDVVQPEPTLSRRHATLQMRWGTWTLEDHASKNGTWVNGRRVQRVRLHPGDDVLLGDLPLTALRARRA
jgi:pSer/pThr/pTyr-binding forkhead associated (FHA) protein